MIAAIPEGPAWAVAMFLAVLLKDAIHALIKRRDSNGSHKLGERVASLEAEPPLAERVASLETAIKSLNGGGARDIAEQLGRIEAQMAENTREIIRLRDWRHDEYASDYTLIMARLHELELHDRGKR